jgi:Tol biopolymer transport system component
MDCLEWPVWSPDGKVLFNRWVRRSIVAREPVTGQEKEILPDLPNRVSHLAVSPDGQRLAFIMRDRQSSKTLLKVMPASGGSAVDLVALSATAEILTGQPAIQLAWTPDGHYLLYAVGSSGPNPKLDFWRIPAQGGTPEHLGLTLEGLLPYGLSIQPDGRRIAFTAGTPLRSEVWVLKDFLHGPLRPPSRKHNQIKGVNLGDRNSHP